MKIFFIDGSQSLYASKWANDPKLLMKIPQFFSTRILTMMSLLWSFSMLYLSYLFADKDRLVYFTIGTFTLCHYITDALDGAVGRYRKEGYIRWGFFVDHVFDVSLLGCIVISLFMKQTPLILEFVVALFSTQMFFIAHFLADIIKCTSTNGTSYSAAAFGIPMYVFELSVCCIFFLAGIANVDRTIFCRTFAIIVALMFGIYVFLLQEVFAKLDRAQKIFIRY